VWITAACVLPLIRVQSTAIVRQIQAEVGPAMIVLGIVGSPAGGKSTVAAYLQELGATWINADQIARGVLEEDEVQQQLIDHFGSDIAASDGRIDRSKLASRVFGDDDA
jgi:dephospho-CoA kinase